jgi:glycosyltransferase involved in cell wall biosynthesis
MRSELKDVQVHLLGDGTLRPWVEERLHSCGLKDRVLLYGYASPHTVVAMMKAADFLLIPSRVESIPLIFGDAMQVGLPVLTTDVGDLGMLVRKGQVGLVVGEASVEAIAAGLRQALEQPEKWAAFRAHTVAFRRWFHPEAMVNTVHNLLEGRCDEGSLSKKLLGEMGTL